MKYYTNAPVSIAAPEGATTMHYKSQDSASASVSVTDGVFVISLSVPGTYFYQITATNGTVLQSGSIEVLQDIAHAAANFDPRSDAEKTLEALDAKIAGRALTIQQSKITVGDKSIEYMNSIEELLKWRDHFQQVVNREHGHPAPNLEIYTLRKG